MEKKLIVDDVAVCDKHGSHPSRYFQRWRASARDFPLHFVASAFPIIHNDPSQNVGKRLRSRPKQSASHWISKSDSPWKAGCVQNSWQSWWVVCACWSLVVLPVHGVRVSVAWFSLKEVAEFETSSNQSVDRWFHQIEHWRPSTGIRWRGWNPKSGWQFETAPPK